MKVVVTSMGETLDSQVDLRFGRAAFFVVVDTETDEFKSLDNKVNVNAMQGAGVQAAETVVREGANVIITGHCGPRAHMTLSAGGVKIVVGASGTVEEALKRFKEGELKETSSPDVEGHWV